MFTLKKTEKTKLEETIDELMNSMSVISEETPEYAAMADQLVKLYKLKEVDKPERLKPDTLVLAATNLVGILVIVGYEQNGIITTKALPFIKKLF